MPRTTIQQDGRVTYRTALFASLPKAETFARCLQSNSVRFERVLVQPSATSKTPRWFVTFEPTSEIRKDFLFAGQQDARGLRATEQEFIFWPDTERISVYWCFSVFSGETYEVSLANCTCPDYEFRCEGTGMQCKHMIAWSAQTDKRVAVISADEMARRINLDY